MNGRNLHLDQIIKHSGWETWRTLDKDQGQSLRKGTKLAGTLVTYSKVTFFLSLLVELSWGGWVHSSSLVIHSIPISLSFYRSRLERLPALPSEGATDHLGEASLVLKGVKKEPPNLLNFIWTSNSTYVAIGETSRHVGQQDRKKEWLCFFSNVIELLRTIEITNHGGFFYLGTFILHAIKFYIMHRIVGFSIQISCHWHNLEGIVFRIISMTLLPAECQTWWYPPVWEYWDNEHKVCEMSEMCRLYP